MKITIVGSGYVGLCTAAGFATFGHGVTCIDVDKNKVEKINRGEAPIYEKGLGNLLLKAVRSKKLSAKDSLDGAGKTDFVFIAVGTPASADGSINLSYVQKASADIGKFIRHRGKCVIVVKSTVLPETTEKIIIPAIEKASGRKVGDFGICVNPEFLREGKAMDDFFNPDRIVIGQFDHKSGESLRKLYKNFKCPVKMTDMKTAEVIKYASNSFLATKISFIDEIGNFCKAIGVDVNEVADGMGMDKRIGSHFLQAGIGFGGSCFGKDVSALLDKTEKLGRKSKILEAILDINERQPLRITSLLGSKIPLNKKTVAILGMAFKEDTDDIRDSPAIPIIRKLLDSGCIIRCYDPKAADNMKKVFPDLTYCEAAKEAVRGADACLILTGWKEFKNLSDKDFKAMKGRVIIEGRRILDRKKVKHFEGVCW